jgi:hypothetical protein
LALFDFSQEIITGTDPMTFDGVIRVALTFDQHSYAPLKIKSGAPRADSI